MNQISKVFLACACSLSGLTIQAQDHTAWSNDFSNTSQPLNVVGRGICRMEYSTRVALMPFSAIPSGEIIPYLSKHVHRKMQNKYKYGQVSAHIIALIAMW